MKTFVLFLGVWFNGQMDIVEIETFTTYEACNTRNNAILSIYRWTVERNFNSHYLTWCEERVENDKI